MARSRRLIRIVVALGIFVGLGVLFVSSVRRSRSAPYTITREQLSHWSVSVETSSDPGTPILVLRPPPELPLELFTQVFARMMESMSASAISGIPLVLRAEFDRAFGGRTTPEELAAAARNAGLESVELKPQCLGYRRVSEPGVTRQLYFVLFDSPEFWRFREQIGAGSGETPRLDPTALSPVLLVAESGPTGGWLPLLADPASDCVAPFATE